jgi:hypothetical protein
MPPRTIGRLIGSLLLIGVACKPGAPAGDDTGATTGSTSGVQGNSTTTGDATATPTSGTTSVTTSGADPSSSSSSSSTGEPVVCGYVPVTPGGPLACGGEELALDDRCDQLAGYEVCPNDSIHRHTQVDCNVKLVHAPCSRPDPDFGCQSDAECDEYPNGLCADSSEGCFCRYSCSTDDDCGAGNACICPTTWAEGHPNESGPFGAYDPCVPAQCHSDADCGDLRCGLSVGGCYQAEGLYCHTPEDMCEGHQDCQELDLGDRCAYSLDEGRWTCVDFFNCE